MNPANSYETAGGVIPINVQSMTPKALNLRGNQFNPYPQYMDKMLSKNKQNIRKNNLAEIEEDEEKHSHTLTKELEKQIHELRKLTKIAKGVY